MAHVGLRFSRSVWLGDSPYLLTLGHNNNQEREWMLWDSRNMTSNTKRERIDSSTGPLVPIFDADLNILTLAGKGDSLIRLYEFCTSNSEMLSPLSCTNVGDPVRGLAMLPKTSCDRMACEIIRLLKLTDGAVQPVSVLVPRKEKLKYHADLYPPTFSDAPSSQTAAEWISGASNEVRYDIAAIVRHTCMYHLVAAGGIL
jgi:hypothetical protein